MKRKVVNGNNTILEIIKQHYIRGLEDFKGFGGKLHKMQGA